MAQPNVRSPKKTQDKVDDQGFLGPDGILSKILHNHMFDHVMGMVIMLNMGVIIVETDHAADHDDSLPWVDALGWVILLIFIVELVLRLVVFHTGFFHDHWNTFDFVIVVTDSAFSFLGLILGSVFPVSTLRVFRLCKLARVSKVFRVFPELRIMMAGLLGSMRAIFWGSVLLAFVLFVWAIIAVQFINPLNRELAEKGVLDDCERCPRAYASVLQATLTFSQQIVAGDSWGQATIPLIEHYPVTALYFLAVFLSVGFAVMNLILGVVVNVAQSEHDRLKGELEEEKNTSRMSAQHNLRQICQEMDLDCSGELSKEELLKGYHDREDFRESIAELDLTEEDMNIAFTGMDQDKSGTVSYDEFLKKIYKMKDSDAQFLMEQVKSNIMQVKEVILENQKNLSINKSRLNTLEKLAGLPPCEPQEEAKDEAKEDAEAITCYPSPSDPSNIQGADQKPSLLLQDETQPKLTEKALGEAFDEMKKCSLDPNLRSAPGEGQTIQEIRDTLLNVSQHLQGEVREMLRHIEKSLDKSLELHVSNTSSLLSCLGSQNQKPEEELSTVRRNLSSGFISAPMCCARV